MIKCHVRAEKLAGQVLMPRLVETSSYKIRILVP